MNESAIRAALERFHQYADGNPDYRGSAAEVLVERLEMALLDLDWREHESTQHN